MKSASNEIESRNIADDAEGSRGSENVLRIGHDDLWTEIERPSVEIVIGSIARAVLKNSVPYVLLLWCAEDTVSMGGQNGEIGCVWLLVRGNNRRCILG